MDLMNAKQTAELFGSGCAGLVTYEFTVDDSGEEFGFVYVSCFRAVATSQLHENTRSKKAKSAGSGYPGLVTYDPSVDRPGEEFGVIKVSLFWEVATSQLPKIAR